MMEFIVIRLQRTRLARHLKLINTREQFQVDDDDLLFFPLSIVIPIVRVQTCVRASTHKKCVLLMCTISSAYVRFVEISVKS